MGTGGGKQVKEKDLLVNGESSNNNESVYLLASKGSLKNRKKSTNTHHTLIQQDKFNQFEV